MPNHHTKACENTINCTLKIISKFQTVFFSPKWLMSASQRPACEIDYRPCCYEKVKSLISGSGHQLGEWPTH